MKPLVTNAADEVQVKEAANKEKRQMNTHIDDLKFILSTPGGRRMIWKSLKDAGILVLSFNNSGSITAFNEGQRNTGLRLVSDIIQADLEACFTMVREAMRSEN